MSLPSSAKAALQQAEAEGLTLLKADNISGYKAVYADNSSKDKPYQAQVRRGSKQVNLGRFVTAEEAALCFARTDPLQKPSNATGGPQRNSLAALRSRTCRARIGL